MAEFESGRLQRQIADVVVAIFGGSVLATVSETECDDLVITVDFATTPKVTAELKFTTAGGRLSCRTTLSRGSEQFLAATSGNTEELEAHLRLAPP